MKIDLNQLTSIVALVLVVTLLIPSPSSMLLLMTSPSSQPHSSSLLSSSSSIPLQVSQLYKPSSSFSFPPSLFSPHDAYAITSYELQSGDANGGCEAIGGTWDSGKSTCTLNSNLTLNGGDLLT